MHRPGRVIDVSMAETMLYVKSTSTTSLDGPVEPNWIAASPGDYLVSGWPT